MGSVWSKIKERKREAAALLLPVVSWLSVWAGLYWFEHERNPLMRDFLNLQFAWDSVVMAFGDSSYVTLMTYWGKVIAGALTIYHAIFYGLEGLLISRTVGRAGSKVAEKALRYQVVIRNKTLFAGVAFASILFSIVVSLLGFGIFFVLRPPVTSQIHGSSTVLITEFSTITKYSVSYSTTISFATITATTVGGPTSAIDASFILGIIAGGLVSGISLFLAQWLFDWFNRPILEVDKKISPIVKTIHLESGRYGTLERIELDRIPYLVNRIRVRNNGKTAAKNCKAILEGVFDSEPYHELVCWSLPRERYVMTINAGDGEYVDLCAVCRTDPSIIMRDKSPVYGDRDKRMGATLAPQEIPRRIAPTEEGWQNPANRNRVFDTLGQGDLNFTLTVTAKNASPYECKITILAHQKLTGRIVSFSD